MVMSAFSPKADIALLDHFVGPGKYCWRNCETECLRGLEINDKFVLIRYLHWQVGRPLSLEDAIYIDGGLPELRQHRPGSRSRSGTAWR